MRRLAILPYSILLILSLFSLLLWGSVAQAQIPDQASRQTKLNKCNTPQSPGTLCYMSVAPAVNVEVLNSSTPQPQYSSSGGTSSRSFQLQISITGLPDGPVPYGIGEILEISTPHKQPFILNNPSTNFNCVRSGTSMTCTPWYTLSAADAQNDTTYLKVRYWAETGVILPDTYDWAAIAYLHNSGVTLQCDNYANGNSCDGSTPNTGGGSNTGGGGGLTDECDPGDPFMDPVMCETVGNPCDPNSISYDPANCLACTEVANPMLPNSTTSDGSFIFTLAPEELCPTEFWIDPPVSAGYDYEITGTDFTRVTMPPSHIVPDPDGYIVTYNGSNINLNPGQSHNFTTPVSNFSISGINPNLELDPGNNMAFPAGIDVGTPAGTVTITQTPVTVEFPLPNTAPIANAGPDATGQAPHNFNLDGSDSSDPDGDALTYHWRQVSGPNTPLKNAQTATPMIYGKNVITPTTMAFELIVEDSSGAMSVPDQVELTMLPFPKMNQCTPWNRDKLVDSLNFYPEGNGYSVTQVIKGQIQSDLQSWVNDIHSRYTDFGKFEIKSYLRNAGTGNTPELLGSALPNMPPLSRDFTVPASPAPPPFWTGGHFQANTWYRLDTKINVRRANGYSHDVLNREASYVDPCVYQTVYFKIDAQSGKLQTGIGTMKDPNPPLTYRPRPVIGRPVIRPRPGIRPRPVIGRPVISRPTIIPKNPSKKLN